MRKSCRAGSAPNGSNGKKFSDTSTIIKSEKKVKSSCNWDKNRYLRLIAIVLLNINIPQQQR